MEDIDSSPQVEDPPMGPVIAEGTNPVPLEPEIQVIDPRMPGEVPRHLGQDASLDPTRGILTDSMMDVTKFPSTVNDGIVAT